MTFEIVDALGGGVMILANGFQWGPRGAKVDRSGAYDTVFKDRAEALEVWCAEGNSASDELTE